MSRLAIVAILASLVACTSPQQEAAWRADAQRPMTCAGADDCSVKWSRALEWVTDNSQFRLQIANDSLIQSAGPGDEDPASAFIVTKRSLGDGKYQIVFRSGCSNMIGCVPSGLALQASFNDYVLGP